MRADHHPPGRRRRCEGIDEREDVLERDPVVRGAVRLDHDAGDRAQLLLEVRDRLPVIRVAGIARAERREGDHVIVQLRRVDALEDRGNGSSRGRGRGDHGRRRRGARHGRRGVRGCRGSRGLLGGWRRRAAAGGENERKKSERPPHHDGISRARAIGASKADPARRRPLRCARQRDGVGLAPSRRGPSRCRRCRYRWHRPG